MTVKEIKAESKERFTVYRYKAMPAYCVLLFVILNILVVTGLLCALTVFLPWYVTVILWWYGVLLLLLALFFAGPFSYSMADYYLRSYKANTVDETVTFSGFRKFDFARTAIMFLVRFAITLLLTCLLIVPGIIFAIKTSMSYYIMCTDSKVGTVAAFKASSEMMKKKSGAYFKLILSFVGWFLLCIVTLGTGFIYVMPYFNTCKVIFFNRIVQGSEQVNHAVVADETPVQAVQSDESESSSTVEAETVIAVEAVSEVAAEEQPVIVAEIQSDESTSAEPVVIAVSGSEDKAEPTEAPAEVVVAEPAVAEPVTAADAANQDEQPNIDDKEEEERAAAKEAIRKRIEELKRERNKSGSRPQPAVHPQKPPVSPESAVVAGHERKNVSKAVDDEFAPERIEVEIVEE